MRIKNFNKSFLFLVVSLAACGGGGSGSLPPGDKGSAGLSQIAPPALESAVQIELSQSPSAAHEARRLQQWLMSSDFSATGLYAPPLAKLHVRVEGALDKGVAKAYLLIGTYSRYHNYTWTPQEVELQVGDNNITASAEGGLVYIRYIGESPPFDTHKLTFTFDRGFIKAPHYVLGTTSANDWAQQLATRTASPDVVMESRRTIMVFSRSNALKWRSYDQDFVLRTADTVADAEDAISGLDGRGPQHTRNPHKILMTEAPAAYTLDLGAGAYAFDYRVAFSPHNLTGAFTPAIAGDAAEPHNTAWGTWHELGHLHQQHWTWDSMAEVTVNIYSLAAQRALGVGLPAYSTDQALVARVKAYLAKPALEKNFNDESVGPFVRLYMLRQLWNVFGDGFFQTLHRETRESPPEFANDAARMRYFMLKACTISGKNLSTFFKTWGLPASESVYTEIDKLGLPLPAVDPSTMIDAPTGLAPEGLHNPAKTLSQFVRDLVLMTGLFAD